MKLPFHVGDKVQVLAGKDSGKQAQVVFIDKKKKRVRLEGLKKKSLKTKKGSREIHGTYHLANLKVLAKPEAPQAAEG